MAGDRDGRRENAATPDGGPTPDTPEEAVLRTGRMSRRRAGPDGPDASVIGDTFKHGPGRSPASPSTPRETDDHG